MCGEHGNDITGPQYSTQWEEKLPLVFLLSSQHSSSFELISPGYGIVLLGK